MIRMSNEPSQIEDEAGRAPDTGAPIRRPALFWTLVLISFGLCAAAVIRLALLGR